MSVSSRGLLLVISGPSGAGKTSVCNEVLRRLPRSRWSVSITTRAPRGKEQDGVEYHFVTLERAQQMIAEGKLLEHAEYLGNTYGTPLEPVQQAIAQGEVLVMEIDVQGAAQIARNMPESLRIFVLPPDHETLVERLAGRKTETAEQQQRRIGEAEREITFARESGAYQHFVTNDILERCVSQVLGIVTEALQSR